MRGELGSTKRDISGFLVDFTTSVGKIIFSYIKVITLIEAMKSNDSINYAYQVCYKTEPKLFKLFALGPFKVVENH